MKRRNIETSLGVISTRIREVVGSTPILFLHGVYFDQHLWDYHADRIRDRTVITVDMPFHGRSSQILKIDWTLEDCACILIELLDSFGISKVIGIGHSWGSMTLLRAATQAPERFQSLGLCNMPFKRASPAAQLRFRLQYTLLGYRKFYTKQTARSLYGKYTLARNPGLLKLLEATMNRLTNKEIILTDRAVILRAKNSESSIRQLKVPALALRGREDYAPESRYIRTTDAAGGHVSPVEDPEKVLAFIQEVIDKGANEGQPTSQRALSTTTDKAIPLQVQQ